MKVILKDKFEFTASMYRDSVNPKSIDADLGETAKFAAWITVNSEENIDAIKEKLTDDNISDVTIVSGNLNKKFSFSKVVDFGLTITDYNAEYRIELI